MKKNRPMTRQICESHMDVKGGALVMPNTRMPIKNVYWYIKKTGYSVNTLCEDIYPHLRKKEVKRLIKWMDEELIPMVKELL